MGGAAGKALVLVDTWKFSLTFPCSPWSSKPYHHPRAPSTATAIITAVAAPSTAVVSLPHLPHPLATVCRKSLRALSHIAPSRYLPLSVDRCANLRRLPSRINTSLYYPSLTVPGRWAITRSGVASPLGAQWWVEMNLSRRGDRV